MRARDWRVFAACRRQKDCENLQVEGFETVLIDYAKPETIEIGLETVLDATGGRLDALFNNGAYAIPGAVEDLPTQALRAIFEANFFGWHTLTRAVIPVMRAQGQGRIVQCSSILGLITLPWRGAYNATKFAIEGLTDTLRIEMRGTGIHICLIEPGPITTKIRENSIPHFEKWIDWENAAQSEQYRHVLRDRLYNKTGRDPFELPPGAVSAKLIHALESERPKARYPVTFPAHMMSLLRRALPTRTLDWILSR